MNPPTTKRRIHLLLGKGNYFLRGKNTSDFHNKSLIGSDGKGIDFFFELYQMT